MIFGPGGHVHDPPGPIIPDLRYTTLPEISQGQKYYFENLRISRNRKCVKSRVPENPWDRFTKFLEILNMGSISYEKHAMAIWQIFNSIEGIRPTHPIPIPTPASATERMAE